MNDVKLYKKDEVSQAVNNVLNKDQLNLMLAPTPAQYVRKRPAKGGGEWSYVSGAYIKKVLNFMFGWDWDFTMISYDINWDAKQVLVHGRLTVRTNDQEIIKEQFGRNDIAFKKNSKDSLDLGNDLKGASTDALKKCASELGIASDIYAPEEFKHIKIVDDQEMKMEKKFREVLEALDQYEGQDKEKIREEIKKARKDGSHSIKFYDEQLQKMNSNVS